MKALILFLFVFSVGAPTSAFAQKCHFTLKSDPFKEVFSKQVESKTGSLKFSEGLGGYEVMATEREVVVSDPNSKQGELLRVQGNELIYFTLRLDSKTNPSDGVPMALVVRCWM